MLILLQASARGKYGQKRLIFRFFIQGDAYEPTCRVKQELWAEDADMRAPVLHELKMELQEYIDIAIRDIKTRLGEFMKKLPIPIEINVRGTLLRTLELKFVCPLQYPGCLAPKKAPIVVESKESSRWLKVAILTVQTGIHVVQGRIGEFSRDMKELWTT